MLKFTNGVGDDCSSESVDKMDGQEHAKSKKRIPNKMKKSDAKSCSMKLPAGYQPTDFDVVCGRGRGLYHRPGNKKFRAIIRNHLKEYEELKTKVDKSASVNQIIDNVLSQNGGTVRFVRQVSTDVWEELGYDLIRDKVGHAIREAIISRNKNRCSSTTSDGEARENDVQTLVGFEMESSPSRTARNENDTAQNFNREFHMLMNDQHHHIQILTNQATDLTNIPLRDDTMVTSQHVHRLEAMTAYLPSNQSSASAIAPIDNLHDSPFHWCSSCDVAILEETSTGMDQKPSPSSPYTKENTNLYLQHSHIVRRSIECNDLEPAQIFEAASYNCDQHHRDRARSVTQAQLRQLATSAAEAFVEQDRFDTNIIHDVEAVPSLDTDKIVDGTTDMEKFPSDLDTIF